MNESYLSSYINKASSEYNNGNIEYAIDILKDKIKNLIMLLFILVKILLNIIFDLEQFNEIKDILNNNKTIL